MKYTKKSFCSATEINFLQTSRFDAIGRSQVGHPNLTRRVAFHPTTKQTTPTSQPSNLTMPPETEALLASLHELQISLSEPSATQRLSETADASAASRDDRLYQELEQVRAVNGSIAAVLDSIVVAESNLEKVVATTKNVDSLLNLWTRILSQAEHTQRLVFDPKWEGATKDEQLRQQRLAAIAAQQAQAKAQAEKRAQEMAAASQRRKDAEEQKRKRDATLQKRIYGNKLGSGKASVSATSSSVLSAPNPRSTTMRPTTASTTTTEKTTSSSSVPTRQRSVLRNASNTAPARANMSRTADGRLSNSKG
ncbi:DASH complex subunit Duo1-domain-containing protein [Lipomyces tetrasporus]|uniref:DASH complex subunit DUO1 n=1 Tax=Lipomyces tetrasporus TaxID=54092 RepID=A0AAD7QSY2_9ASCO|nr:DASH complex subunit Duo1-domain-containing protein [Lipomyces tetrasporus]KAJ8100865.1 DASH complex subunit Duo1-domain-containing protein [Lipomyces tetrasporus]